MLSKKSYISGVDELKEVIFQNFFRLIEMVDDDESLISSVCEKIVNHLEILSKSFHGYFERRELETSEKWIINPYFFNLDYM